MYFYQVSAPNFSHPLPPIHVHVHVGSWWKSKLVRDWRSTCTHVHACQPALYQQWDNPHKLEGHAYGNSHDQTRTMSRILSKSVHTSMLNKCHVFYSLVRLLMLMLMLRQEGSPMHELYPAATQSDHSMYSCMSFQNSMGVIPKQIGQPIRFQIQ